MEKKIEKMIRIFKEKIVREMRCPSVRKYRKMHGEYERRDVGRESEKRKAME